MPICVVGFPLGAMATRFVPTARRSRMGQKIDMVINIGALKGGDHDRCLRTSRPWFVRRKGAR